MNRSLPVVTSYYLTHLGLIFFMYPTDIISSASESHWIAILMGTTLHLIFVSIYLKGLSYFPNKNILDIYLGTNKIISVIFLFPIAIYFFNSLFIAVRAYSEIITIVFLSNTPLWAMEILLLITSTILSLKGLKTILRTGMLIGILFLPLFLFVCFASFQNVDWQYIFPIIGDNSFSFLHNPSYMESFFPITGVFLFIGFVQPLYTFSSKKILLSALALIPFFMLSVYIPILTFGENTASFMFFPFVEAIDSIHINWLMFNRITMFFLLSLITFSILFLSLVMWMFIQIVNRVFPSIHSNYLTLGLSTIVYFICFMIPNWQDVEKMFLINAPFRFFCLIFVPISILYLGLRSKKGAKTRHA